MEQYLIYQTAASLSAGIAVACLSVLFFDLLQRIELEKEVSSESKQLPFLFRILLPLSPNLMFIAKSPSFAQWRNNTAEQLMMAGYDQAVKAEEFICIKLLSCVLGIIIMILFFIAGQPMPALLMFAVLFIYPGIWLKKTIRKRHLEILKALPNVLDLLTLSVEAGKDFITAMRDILHRRKMDALGEELSRTLQEIQLGKQRQKALKDLVNRVRQAELSSVVNAIIQAEELGVSIGQLLRIQGDQLRAKRFVRAEKLANEAPVKILFPVIVFIFPSVIVILMGPIVMQAFKTMMR